MLGSDHPGELRAGERLRRSRRAAAQHGRRAAWAWRSRTRASSTRRSASSRRASSAPPSSRSSTACRRGSPPQLDFQAIVDLVGDKIREIFGTQDMSIALYDRQTGLMYDAVLPRAWRALSGRCRRRSGRVSPRTSFRHRQPLVINENLMQRAAELGSRMIGDTSIGGTRPDQLRRRPDPEGRRSASASSRSTATRRTPSPTPTCACCTTLANAMTVALENARLFDETQRLFKAERATRRRARDHQQRAAGARRRAQHAGHLRRRRRQDPRDLRPGGHGHPDLRSADRSDPLSVRLRGRRNGSSIDSRPRCVRTGFAAHVLRTRETLVINENMPSAIGKVRQLHAARHGRREIGALRAAGRAATRRAGSSA